MNLFKKRPLGLILGIILSGLYLFSLLSDFILLLLIILCLCSVLFIFIIPRARRYKKIGFLLLLLLFSGAVSRLYFDVFFSKATESGDEVLITARVYDITERGDMKALTAVCQELDGEPSRERIIINVYSDCEVNAGDIITLECALTPLYESGGSDTNRYNLSRGISASCYVSSVSVTDSTPYPLEYRMKLWRNAISEHLISLSGEDAGGLTAALLLGDTSYMNERTALSFSKIGITHILALSGTHITLLALALSKLMRLLGVSKKAEKIILIFVIIAFMALVGFPSSVMRAGIMVIISTVLYLICADYDSITSLFVALGVIILLEPYAVFDVGLLLSFLATLGILIYVEYVRKRSTDTQSYGFRYKAKMLLMFSVFAVAGTQVICALYFDTVSAISVLTTLIFSVITEYVLYLGIITALFGSFIPIGKLLSWLCGITDSLSYSISRLDGIEFSAGFVEIKLLSILLFALLLYFAVASVKKPERFVMLITVLYVCVCCIGIFLNLKNTLDERVVYSKEASDCFIVCSDGEVSMIDVGNHRAKDYYKSLELLYSENLCALDNLVFIGYSDESGEYASRFFKNFTVKRIYLTEPDSSYAAEYAADIISAAEKFGAEVIFFDFGDETYLGNISLTAHELPTINASRTFCSFTLCRGKRLISYLTPDSSVYSPLAEYLFAYSDAIVFGSFGSADYPYFPELTDTDGKLIIIPDEKRVAATLIDTAGEIVYTNRHKVFD